MLILFSRISTWLFIEIIATFLLAILNMLIPILMMFSAYRSLANFYFSSTALSSSLINYLYLFYLIQTIRLKTLSENNCRALYYFQSSCIVVLAYTVVAMHANFVLCLFPSSTLSSDEHKSVGRRCLQSSSICLRRFFRRFCVCFILLIWSISFTSTIPLLYTIDSNEKYPKPVYCPGTKELNYLEEWFDRNRFTQTLIFNLIPLLISLFLSFIALLKLFYDCLIYFYLRLQISQCFLCRKNSSSSSSNLPIQSCRRWFTVSFLRFLLVISCCLLACIYPIVMRFYLIYFSVFVPLIFSIFNYSLTLTQSTTMIENENIISIIEENSLNKKSIQPNDEQLELQSSLVDNLLNKQDEISNTSTPHRKSKRNKRFYFSNHLYEHTQNMCIK